MLFVLISLSVQITFRLPNLLSPGGGVTPIPLLTAHLELSAKLGRFLTSPPPPPPRSGAGASSERRRPDSYAAAACEADSAGRVSAISDIVSWKVRELGQGRGEAKKDDAPLLVQEYEFQVPLDSEPGMEELR